MRLSVWVSFRICLQAIQPSYQGVQISPVLIRIFLELDPANYSFPLQKFLCCCIFTFTIWYLLLFGKGLAIWHFRPRHVWLGVKALVRAAWPWTPRIWQIFHLEMIQITTIANGIIMAHLKGPGFFCLLL